VLSNAKIADTLTSVPGVEIDNITGFLASLKEKISGR
jgi:hypothetical protein